MMIYANHYYNFGFNVTHISSTRNSSHKDDRTVMKSPSHEWVKYMNSRQTIEELHDLNWHEASGLGVVLGYDNLRALDIDGCKDLRIVRDFLIMLNLPDDYQWVNISGSGEGFHIIFYADERLCCMAPVEWPLIYRKSTGKANFEIAKPPKSPPDGPVPCQKYAFSTPPRKPRPKKQPTALPTGPTTTAP